MSSWHNALFPMCSPSQGCHCHPRKHLSKKPWTVFLILSHIQTVTTFGFGSMLSWFLQPHVLPPPPLTCTCFSGLPASHLPASDLSFFFFFDLTFLYSSTPQTAVSAFSVSGSVPKRWQNEESIKKRKPCGQWKEPTFTVLCETQVFSVCKEGFGTRWSLKGPFSKNVIGNSLMVQWLGLSTFAAKGLGFSSWLGN